MNTPQTRLRVLGIDPGSRKTGWGLVDVDRRTRKVVHVDNGVFMLDPKGELTDRLVQLCERLRAVILEHRPDVAAVEDVFVSKGARSALVLGQARGAALATVGLCAVPVTSLTTSRVKARVTGRGRASKDQVAEMVRVLLGLKEVPFEDAADALAVAVCHAMEQGLEPLAGAGAAPPSPKTKGSARAGFAALARAQGKA